MTGQVIGFHYVLWSLWWSEILRLSTQICGILVKSISYGNPVFSLRSAKLLMLVESVVDKITKGVIALPPRKQTISDNLEIGLYLARGRFGATLDDILQVAIGYSPNGGFPIEHYAGRFRNAQLVGRDAFRQRTPGYFTFNAMPFGDRYIYKATWYVWRNPQTR